MSIVYIVLPLALAIVFGAALAFVWASRRGQFDDLETPAMRMLHDDEVVRADSERARSPGSTAG